MVPGVYAGGAECEDVEVCGGKTAEIKAVAVVRGSYVTRESGREVVKAGTPVDEWVTTTYEGSGGGWASISSGVQTVMPGGTGTAVALGQAEAEGVSEGAGVVAVEQTKGPTVFGTDVEDIAAVTFGSLMGIIAIAGVALYFYLRRPKRV